MILGYAICLSLALKEIVSFPEYTFTLNGTEQEITLPHEKYTSNELERFPSNYDEVIQINNLSVDQRNRIELLRFGKSEIDEKGLDYAFLLKKSTPLLLTSQMLQLYVEYEMIHSKERIIESNLISQLGSTLTKLNIYINILDKLPLFPNQKMNEIKNTLKESLQLLQNKKYVDTIASLNSLPDSITKNISKFLFKFKLNDEIEEINQIHAVLGLPQLFTKQDLVESNSEYIFSLEGNSWEELPTIYVENDTEFYNNVVPYLKYKTEILSQLNISNEDTYTTLKDILTIEEKSSGITVEPNKLEQTYRRILTVLSKLDYPSTQRLTTLIKTIENNEKRILTVSPYINNLEEEIEIEDANFDQDLGIQEITQPKGTVRIPVLMYHQIAVAPKGSSKFVKGLYVSPDDFEEQIAYLTRNNIKTLSSKEFAELLATGKNPKQKSVMLTFDDGHPTHYAAAYPILKRYGQTGVFFVVSSRTSLSSNQLREMAQNGMSIDSHSATHPNLQKTDELTKLYSEIAGSKAALQARTGKRVYAIAYPGCVADTETYSVVANSGYSLGFSCGRKIDHYPSNSLSISRVHVFTEMERFLKALAGKL